MRSFLKDIWLDIRDWDFMKVVSALSLLAISPKIATRIRPRRDR